MRHDPSPQKDFEEETVYIKVNRAMGKSSARDKKHYGPWEEVVVPMDLAEYSPNTREIIILRLHACYSTCVHGP